MHGIVQSVKKFECGWIRMSKDDLQKNFKKSDLGKSSIQSVKAFTFIELI